MKVKRLLKFKKASYRNKQLKIMKTNLQNFQFIYKIYKMNKMIILKIQKTLACQKQIKKN